MNPKFSLQVKFWGVRGSIPTPRAGCLGVGGNTSCIQLCAPGCDEVFVIDAGSGARDLGSSLLPQLAGNPVPIHLFLTHFHWDHIQGLPFFGPLFHPATKIGFFADRPAEEIRESLEGQMTQPYFPVPFEAVSASRSFHQLSAQPLSIGPITVTSFPLNHPQRASGYRFEIDGSVFVHVADHEHGSAAVDAGVCRQAEGADVLVYDAQYTPAEYESKRGWGHSTYTEAARMARDAGAKRLVLFHHDPSHDDQFLEELLREAREHFPLVDLAREGCVLEF